MVKQQAVDRVTDINGYLHYIVRTRKFDKFTLETRPLTLFVSCCCQKLAADNKSSVYYVYLVGGVICSFKSQPFHILKRNIFYRCILTFNLNILTEVHVFWVYIYILRVSFQASAMKPSVNVVDHCKSSGQLNMSRVLNCGLPEVVDCKCKA